MNILINNSSMQPIYEQIVSQIKTLILGGNLLEETPLPSVRSLSRDLKISALTVKKAYDTLEQEGLIITIHGKGSYVAHTNANLVAEEQKKQVEAQFELAIRKGRSCGLTTEEINLLFQLMMEDLS